MAQCAAVFVRYGRDNVTDTAPVNLEASALDHIIIRFAGDSGDGMQLTGDRFTSASAMFGNDLATMPDFPAEIRAPAGTLAGVSAFQVQISDHDITTPGDAPSILVAMNPAALASELHRLDIGGTIIANEDTFDERNLAKAGYPINVNPLEDGSLANYTLIKVPMTSITKEACAPLGIKPRDADRSKNFFALGLVSWMYSRPTDTTLDWIKAKFAKNEQVVAANTAAFKAGHAFGETAELSAHQVEIKPAKLEPGTYTNIDGIPLCHGVWSPLRIFQAFQCSWVPTQSRLPQTFCTSSRRRNTSAFVRCRPKTKLLRSHQLSALRLAAISA